ncbi:Ppx/GppA phosphatase family protein [Flexibacterium corallicola]|uniref:Ppx/GppA phosphatase family protein n=1 Tax=Flexibacterium corallicola TaxID=3037259 RepID=UPI00286FA38B|nr:Ppx/GppA phosphatase family protein [Pseudovibrio sp. M1P-2-3]
MKKTGDGSSAGGSGAPGTAGPSFSSKRRKRKHRKGQPQSSSARVGDRNHSAKLSQDLAQETGSARPEGAKRQRKSRRNKPNRAERRALARQVASTPVVEVKEGGTAISVSLPEVSKPSSGDDKAVSKPQQETFTGNERKAGPNHLRLKNASHNRSSYNHHGSGSSEEPRASTWGEPRSHLRKPWGNRSSDEWRGGARPPWGRHHDARQDKLYAALDLGTNNCRLLIAKPDHRGFRVVDAYSRIVRLGEGVGQSGRISDRAMGRAIEALKVCQEKLEDSGVERARLIATEACRAAVNGEEFIRRAREEAGIDLEIVTQETEARLAVAGCVSLVDPEADGVLLFDIGGGSSEIVWLDLRNRYGARGFALTRFIRTWTSLPVGVVNLAERHGGKIVSSSLFEDMVEDVSKMLETFPLADELSDAIRGGNVHMLGTSGTVTTLAGVHLGLKRYDRRRVDGVWMHDDDVSQMIQQLLNMSYEERVENPCIGQDRADLVLAGCAILEAIRRRWPCERLRVADRGLREGILMEMMAADKVWRKPAGRR